MTILETAGSVRPEWVRAAFDALADAQIAALVGFADAAAERGDTERLLRVAVSLVQTLPHSFVSWQIALDAGLLLSDVGLQRAACERMHVIARASGLDDAARYYLELDGRLAAGLSEPSYSLDQDYASCEWIEGGLTYGVDALHTCCIPNQGGAGGWEHIADYDPSTKPAILDFVRTKQRMRHAAQQGGVARCQGCSRLHRQRWESRVALVDTLNFSHFHRCNLRCNYCYLEQPDHVVDDKARNDPNRLADHMRYWTRSGLLAPDAVVYWGGGEPSILKDFDEVLTVLLEHGCRNVVNTNAIRYSPAIEAALQRPGQMVVCSIDAGTAATYRSKKGADVFDRVLAHCARYAAAATAGRMALKYIVDADNHDDAEVDGFVAAATRVGVREVILDVNSYNGELSDAMVAAMGRIARELHGRGIHGFIGGCGVFGYPELDVHGRLRAELESSSDMDDDAIRRCISG